MTDQYTTLSAPAEGYFMEKGSKFLAFAFPVQSEEEAQTALQTVRKLHPKARHFCTALRLFPDASLERSNDDGEPSGSAGRPILGQLIKFDLTNVFVVVVRYFGGTKLGIPGLIEAYKTSTIDALEKAKTSRVTVLTCVDLEMPYSTFPHFLNFCKQADIPVLGEGFTSRAVITIGLRKATCHSRLTEILHEFSKMDFKETEDYLRHLDMNMTWTDKDEMVLS